MQALARPADRAELLAAFVSARVFAAITAAATAEHRAGGTGLRAESRAELAVLLLEAPDGSRALPVFADLEALKAWREDVRPVPLTGAQACAAARDEGAAAVLLDPGGAAVTVTELETLAGGWVPVPGSGLSSRKGAAELAPAQGPSELVDALGAALAGERLQAARLLQGPEGLVLAVTARRSLAPEQLADLAQRLVDRLGPALPPQGLDLAQLPAGPGQQVLRRRRGWRRG